MKKVVGLLAFVCSVAFGQSVTLNSKAALVVDTDTDQVLFQKSDDQVRAIASLTKLMTAYVTVEANLPLDEQITITKEDVEATRLRGGPTGVSLPEGTTLSRGDLLHLALMNSQNRAAAALGRTYPGGIAAFVDQMNATAEQLGMVNTHYVDPTGLYNTNTSTADDLAILIKAASVHDVIREYSTSARFHVDSRKAWFGTTNRLISAEKWNILIQKTGFINDAGHCTALITTIGDRKVTIVLLGAASNQTRARDAVSLMYWVEHDAPPSAHEMAQLDPYKSPRRYIRRRKHR